MQRVVACLVITTHLMPGLPSHAQDHLVSSELANDRLTGAAAAYEADMQLVSGWLSTPEAATAAARAGVDVGLLTVSAASLEPEELADLAERARRLRSDPAAGGAGKTIVIILIVVALVWLIALGSTAQDLEGGIFDSGS